MFNKLTVSKLIYSRIKPSEFKEFKQLKIDKIQF